MTLIIVGAVALALVLLVAIGLLVTAGSPDAARAQFGRPLLVGAIIGLAFMPVQVAIQDEIRGQDESRQRERAAEAERRELLLQLALRQDLPGIDLRGQRLAGVYMFGKNLAGANLRGADLRGANLAHADLRSANLTRTQLDGANLYGAELEGAVLHGTSFAGADMRRAKLGMHAWPGDPQVDEFTTTPDELFRRQAEGPAPADFSRADLGRARISQANLSHATFERAELAGTRFTDTILQGASFDHSEILAFMTRVDLCRASFRSATFDHVYYDDVSLRRADLDGASIEAGGFFGVDFRGASLEGVEVPLVDKAEDPDDLPIGGHGVTQTEDAPELPPDLALMLQVSARPAAPVGRCSWGMLRNRLKPRALELPQRRAWAIEPGGSQ